jgi:hypothetical protein
MAAPRGLTLWPPDAKIVQEKQRGGREAGRSRTKTEAKGKQRGPQDGST